MPEETPVAVEPATAEAAAAPAPVYVQLVSTWESSENQAAASLVTPDANGRLPAIVRVGGPSLVRWEPLVGAAGLVIVATGLQPDDPVLGPAPGWGCAPGRRLAPGPAVHQGP